MALQLQPRRTEPDRYTPLGVGRSCLIYRLIHSPYFPVQLIQFLSYSDHNFAGIGMKSDVRKLERDHRIEYGAKTVDLGRLAAEVYKMKELKNAGLKNMTRFVLGKEMEKLKSMPRSRWDLMPFSQSLITLDLALAFNILTRHQQPPSPPPPLNSSGEFESWTASPRERCQQHLEVPSLPQADADYLRRLLRLRHRPPIR